MNDCLLAQFASDTAPFNSLDSIGRWATGLSYKGVQMPSWDSRLFDLKRAATSETYCDEVAGTLARHGLQITELSNGRPTALRRVSWLVATAGTTRC